MKKLIFVLLLVSGCSTVDKPLIVKNCIALMQNEGFLACEEHKGPLPSESETSF